MRVAMPAKRGGSAGAAAGSPSAAAQTRRMRSAARLPGLRAARCAGARGTPPSAHSEAAAGDPRGKRQAIGAAGAAAGRQCFVLVSCAFSLARQQVAIVGLRARAGDTCAALPRPTGAAAAARRDGCAESEPRRVLGAFCRPGSS
jgi:hypothetical protein